MTITYHHYLVLSFVLFAVGVAGVLLRRNALIVLMSIELMLNGANLALLAAARQMNDAAGHGLAQLGDALGITPFVSNRSIS